MMPLRLLFAVTCLVHAAQDQQPSGVVAAAIASTPYYRQQGRWKERHPVQDRAEEMLGSKADRAQTFGDRADAHFGRPLQRGEAGFLEERADRTQSFEDDTNAYFDKEERDRADRHFGRQSGFSTAEEENWNFRGAEESSNRRRAAELDDPRRAIVHGWNGNWERRHRAAAEIDEHGGVKPERPGQAQVMIESKSDHGLGRFAPALSLLGEEAGAEQHGIVSFGLDLLKEIWVNIVITDYPYVCPCNYAKGPDGQRRQLTMEEGGICISASKEGCAKQSAGRIGMLVVALGFVFRY